MRGWKCCRAFEDVAGTTSLFLSGAVAAAYQAELTSGIEGEYTRGPAVWLIFVAATLALVQCVVEVLEFRQADPAHGTPSAAVTVIGEEGCGGRMAEPKPWGTPPSFHRPAPSSPPAPSAPDYAPPRRPECLPDC